MTSGDLTMDEAHRLQSFTAGPGPITDRMQLLKLLDVAAILLDSESPGDPAAVYTVEEIVAGVRELLEPGQTVAVADVRALLPGDSFVECEGGFRWK